MAYTQKDDCLVIAVKISFIYISLFILILQESYTKRKFTQGQTRICKQMP